MNLLAIFLGRGVYFTIMQRRLHPLEGIVALFALFLVLALTVGFAQAGEANAAPRAQKVVLLRSSAVLVQDADIRPLQDADLKVVTKRPPTPEETRALLFAWKVCKHVKSNAIVYAKGGATVGIGAGQMSRVDAVRIAIEKAREIVKLVKDSKKKAQASIQGDLVRVSGKDRDTLQEIIALLRSRDFGIDLQFTNYRSN